MAEQIADEDSLIAVVDEEPRPVGRALLWLEHKYRDPPDGVVVVLAFVVDASVKKKLPVDTRANRDGFAVSMRGTLQHWLDSGWRLAASGCSAPTTMNNTTTVYVEIDVGSAK